MTSPEDDPSSHPQIQHLRLAQPRYYARPDIIKDLSETRFITLSGPAAVGKHALAALIASDYEFSPLPMIDASDQPDRFWDAFQTHNLLSYCVRANQARGVSADDLTETAYVGVAPVDSLEQFAGVDLQRTSYALLMDGESYERRLARAEGMTISRLRRSLAALEIIGDNTGPDRCLKPIDMSDSTRTSHQAAQMIAFDALDIAKDSTSEMAQAICNVDEMTEVAKRALDRIH